MESIIEMENVLGIIAGRFILKSEKCIVILVKSIKQLNHLILQISLMI